MFPSMSYSFFDTILFWLVILFPILSFVSFLFFIISPSNKYSSHIFSGYVLTILISLAITFIDGSAPDSRNHFLFALLNAAGIQLVVLPITIIVAYIKYRKMKI